MIKKSVTLAFALVIQLIPFLTFGQGDIEMADGMMANGKIYVVVAVIAVIILGLFIFLMMIDRRLRKIEQNRGKS